MPQRPLRIVHVLATTNGAPWLLELMREQRLRGHDVSAIIPRGSGTIPQVFTDEGFAFTATDVDMISTRSIVTATRTVFRLARTLRRLRADVVQYHLFPSIVTGRLTAWLADAPLRFSMIPGTYYLEAPVLSTLEIGTAWTDTRVIATCEKTRTLYREGGCPPGKLELIHYGVSPDKFDPARTSSTQFREELGVPAGAPLVGMVAYFYPKGPDGPFTPPFLIGRGLKGHDVVLRAVPTVLARIPEAKFVFVGGPWGADGAAYFDEMRSLACELGVDGSVIFAGERRDVPQALASLDVALQCSLSENLGGSIEALLMERPLVVSAVGGLVDSVKDRETGLLVPPDDPRALADAIVELLQRPEFAKELGRNGRKFMLERFTVRFLADSLDNLYERCSEEEGLAFPPAAGRYRLSRSIIRSFVLPFRVAPLWFRVMKAISGGRLFKRSLRALARRTAEAVVAIPVVTLRGCRLLLRRKLKRDASRPLRIAQVVGTSVGCQWMIEIARGAKERGHDVCAIIDTAEGTLPERLSEAGIPYFRVPMTFAPRRDRLRLVHYALRVPLSAARLARVLRREKIDIVHSHIFSSMIMTRVAASLAGTPRVLSMIPGPRHLEAPLTRFVDRTTQRLDDVTIAGCRFTEEIYRTMHVSPDRLRCIYYGADPERFDPGRADGARIRRESGISADAPVVTLVAQFYPPMFGPQNSPQTRGIAVKGHDYFLAAARIVLAKFPSAKFLLVGGGHGDAGEAYRKKLMNDCESLGIARSVIFTGHRDDVADLLAASDVAVQCSLSENLGGTIESLLMERATIATRVGGMPESVIHGKTGLLVPPADPAALANAIVRLLENRPFAQSLGRAGRQFMLERFTTQRMIADITALYDSFLSDAIRDV